MQNDDKFSLFIPLEIEKGGENSADKYSNMKFKGVASTTRFGRDSDGEILEIDGMDLNDLLSVGHVNWNHGVNDKPSAIIGEPIKAEKVNKGQDLYIEGRLYPSSQKAREIYDLAEVLEKDSDSRRLGFSIEGKALSRDPKDKKRILKSRIVNVAIAPVPKCKGTKMELVKGWGKEVQYEALENSEYLVDATDSNGVRRTVDKNLDIKVWSDDLEKAMVAGAITGTETISKEGMTQEPLKEQSLEGTKKKKKKDKLSKGEVLAQLIEEGYDGDSALRMYDLVVQVENISKNSYCEK